MKFKTRLLVFLLMCAFPYALLELFKTESTTVYLWWEDILGYIAVGSLGLTWIHFWFKKLLSKYDDE